MGNQAVKWLVNIIAEIWINIYDKYYVVILFLCN